MAIGAFATLAVTILGFLFKEILSHQAKEALPTTQHENRLAQIDRDIARGDSLAATVNASADLDELDRLRLAKGNLSGPT